MGYVHSPAEETVVLRLLLYHRKASRERPVDQSIPGGQRFIGGDDPGLCFDEHLARVGPERLWVAERGGQGAAKMLPVEQPPSAMPMGAELSG
jgi:hypothetical protein